MKKLRLVEGFRLTLHRCEVHTLTGRIPVNVEALVRLWNGAYRQVWIYLWLCRRVWVHCDHFARISKFHHGSWMNIMESREYTYILVLTHEWRHRGASKIWPIAWAVFGIKVTLSPLHAKSPCWPKGHTLAEPHTMITIKAEQHHTPCLQQTYLLQICELCVDWLLNT